MVVPYFVRYCDWRGNLDTPNLAMGARRLRDAGFSPWWLLLLLTGIGGLILIILWIFPKK